MAHHHTTGALGEKMAIGWLAENGFKIMHQNWRHSHWEVDIIASKDNILHFIEIKTRRSRKFGYPEEDVTKKKVINLMNASEEFVIQNPGWKQIQFDILSITLLKNEAAEYFFIEDVSI